MPVPQICDLSLDEQHGGVHAPVNAVERTVKNLRGTVEGAQTVAIAFLA